MRPQNILRIYRSQKPSEVIKIKTTTAIATATATANVTDMEIETMAIALAQGGPSTVLPSSRTLE